MVLRFKFLSCLLVLDLSKFLEEGAMKREYKFSILITFNVWTQLLTSLELGTTVMRPLHYQFALLKCTSVPKVLFTAVRRTGRAWLECLVSL